MRNFQIWKFSLLCACPPPHKVGSPDLEIVLAHIAFCTSGNFQVKKSPDLKISNFIHGGGGGDVEVEISRSWKAGGFLSSRAHLRDEVL